MDDKLTRRGNVATSATKNPFNRMVSPFPQTLYWLERERCVMSREFESTIRICNLIKENPSLIEYIRVKASPSDKIVELDLVVDECGITYKEILGLVESLNLGGKVRGGQGGQQIHSTMSCLSCGQTRHTVKWSSEYSVTREDGTFDRARRVTLEEECPNFPKGSKLEYPEKGGLPEKTFLTQGQVNGAKKYWSEHKQ
jgi:hypothetical protein